MNQMVTAIVFAFFMYVHWLEVRAQREANSTELPPRFIGIASGVCEERSSGLEDELRECLRKLPQVILTPIKDCAAASGYTNVRSFADDVCTKPVHVEPILMMRTCLAVRFQDPYFRTAVWQNIVKIMAAKGCVRAALHNRAISTSDHPKVEK